MRHVDDKLELTKLESYLDSLDITPVKNVRGDAKRQVLSVLHESFYRILGYARV